MKQTALILSLLFATSSALKMQQVDPKTIPVVDPAVDPDVDTAVDPTVDPTLTETTETPKEAGAHLQVGQKSDTFPQVPDSETIIEKPQEEEAGTDSEEEDQEDTEDIQPPLVYSRTSPFEGSCPPMPSTFFPTVESLK